MPVLHVPFTKMQGAGNDFVVIDNRFLHFTQTELSAIARRYCERRFGVGADGLLALDPPARSEADYRMRYHNADGSLAGLCGNGARCLARFARDAGLLGDPLVFDAEAGSYSASVPEAQGAPVRLFLPPARDLRDVRLEDGSTIPYVWTGTHHVVALIENIDETDVGARAGPIRHDRAFAPEGTNVNFVEVTGPAELRVRTFEKGVEAETLACGTGALAAAVVARARGGVRDDLVTVRARGGTLVVGFDEAGGRGDSLFLEGPAERVFTGVLDIDTHQLARETQRGASPE